MGNLRNNPVTFGLVFRIAFSVILLLGLVLFWLTMSTNASSSWPIMGWPNPQKYINALTDNDGNDEAAATNLIHAQPISADSLVALAYYQQKSGHPEAAAPVLELAGQMGWRNVTVQSFWAKVALTAGDSTIAAQRIDALMRIQAPNEVWQPQLAELLANPSGLKAMVIQAQNNPDWLSQQFVSFRKGALDTAEINNRLEMLTHAYRAGLTPDCSALAKITNSTIPTDIAQSAERLWVGYCDPKSRLADNGMNLSTAQSDDDAHSRFTWIPLNTGRYGVNIATTNDGGMALHIVGSSNIRETVAQRILALLPGKYDLQWTAMSDSGQPAQGVSFSLHCLSGNKIVPPIRDSKPDDSTSAQFQIPPKNCKVQRLSLMIDQPHSAISNIDLNVSNIAIKPTD